MATRAALQVSVQAKQLKLRAAERRAALRAKERDVVEALRVIRDAARRGDPKALAVIAFCVSPFT